MNIQRLKDLREDKDLLQKDVAEALPIKQQQYSEYEIGKRLIPIDKLSNLADFYKTSIDYILGKTDIKKPFPMYTIMKSCPFLTLNYQIKNKSSTDTNIFITTIKNNCTIGTIYWIIYLNNRI